MVDYLQTFLALLAAISVLIAVHEWGHFLVARRCGVKVLRFSIGFGNPLWKRTFGPDNTEFVIASIPLGGYVKMLDEREGEVAPQESERAFNRQSLGKRAAIVVAGPVFNLLFAIAAYWLMFVVGLPGIKPLVGEVEPDTVAYAAGLRNGDEIIAVNGEKSPTWQAAMEAILPPALLQQPVTLTVFNGGVTQEKRLDTSKVSAMQTPAEVNKLLGLQPFGPPLIPAVNEVDDGSAAQEAGIQVGDEVRIIDDKPISSWEQLVELIHANPEHTLAIVVWRDSHEVELQVTPRAKKIGDRSVGIIGIHPRVDEARLAAMHARWQHGPLQALGKAVTKTWDMSLFSLRMLGEMIVGRASVKNISGPIEIARYAKRSAHVGFTQFIAFLAIVSLSLGVLNLLPIPVLDGGHLMFYLVELLKGSAVSEQTEVIAQRIGMALLFSLMALATYNDLSR